MKSLKLGMLLVAALFATNTFAQTRDEIAIKMNSAGDALNAKNYAEAVKLSKEAIQMLATTEDDAAFELETQAKSMLADSYRMVGLAKAHKRDFNGALVDFTEASKLYRSAGNIQLLRNVEGLISQCYMQLAGVEVKANRYSAAVTICQKGLALNPTDTKLMILAAQCYEKAGNDVESVKMYEKVIDLGKKTPRLKNDGDRALGLLVNSLLFDANKLSDKGNKTAALAKIATAQKYDNSPKIEYMKMTIYNNAKDYASVIKMGPDAANVQTEAAAKADINFMVGAAYVATENNAKAMEFYKKVTTGKYVQTAKDQIEQIEKTM